MGSDEDTVTSEPAHCSGCGTRAPGATPLSWSMQTSERGLQVLCESCTRTNVRSIEAKLEREWW